MAGKKLLTVTVSIGDIVPWEAGGLKTDVTITARVVFPDGRARGGRTHCVVGQRTILGPATVLLSGDIPLSPEVIREVVRGYVTAALRERRYDSHGHPPSGG